MAGRRGSHRKLEVRCELAASPRCRGNWLIEERLVDETRSNDAGVVICGYCSRATKSVGRGNPNSRDDVDAELLRSIDTELKAYLLGWIASDGAIRKGGIAIYIHEQDEPTLVRLRDLVCEELPLKRRKPGLVGFVVSSTRLVSDVCRHLDIAPGKKSGIVGFPQLESDALRWAFLRGLFDGDGSVSSLDAGVRRAERAGWPAPRATLASTSQRMLDGVQGFCGVPCHRGPGALEWSGNNALDLLSKLYDGAGAFLTRKRDAYLDWCYWVPGISGGGTAGKHPLFRWSKVLREAVPPSKAHASDSGFDLTLVGRAHSHGAVHFFRTGIRVQPAFGWYFDVVPRSSISKTGHMLANSIGVIDRGYVGEILVPLIKVDPAAPDLALPARLVQMIPRPVVAAQLVETDSFEDTKRGYGGFGSTGAP